MTDLEAAIGLCQLKRLPDFISKRRSVARKYDRTFEKLDIQLPINDPDHIYFRYVVNLNTHLDKWIKALFKKSVICARPIYKPIHQYLDVQGYTNSQRAWETSISIPIYPTLDDKKIDLVIETFMQVAEG